nr:hypothetical protein GCM10025732_56110 [Glycomyces mayteni]
MFRGFDEQHLEADPRFAALAPTHAPRALVGRAVDVHMSTVGYQFDRSPGRHLAVLGTSAVAADVLTSAALSVARQHEPGSVEFQVAATAAGAEDIARDLVEALKDAGHECRELEPGTILTAPRGKPVYLVWFGADGADGKPGTLRDLLLHGPATGAHVIGWWRGRGGSSTTSGDGRARARGGGRGAEHRGERPGGDHRRVRADLGRAREPVPGDRPARGHGDAGGPVRAAGTPGRGGGLMGSGLVSGDVVDGVVVGGGLMEGGPVRGVATGGPMSVRGDR